MDIREIECPEREIDDAVCAEDDDESHEPPEDSLAALLALIPFSRPLDELIHAPEEDDERARREKQDDGVYDLYDNLPEERVELFEHLSN